MISKAKIKYIRSLELKKNRLADNVFVAEGPKVVGDLLRVMPAKLIVATPEWLAGNASSCHGTETYDVTAEELRKVSFLQTPQDVLAVFNIPEWNDTDSSMIPAGKLYLALDGVQNPGNLGTIIRIADWFGITDIFCSRDTADAFNPKVIQATMGSIARVHIRYVDLPEVLSTLPDSFPVYGTFLDGEDIYSQTLTDEGLIIMGNEGNGISKEVGQKVNRRLLIPNFSTSEDRAESLNVAIATAITCSEFRRKSK